MSDVGLKHAVTFNSLNIQHSIDFSPSALSIAREIRYCIIAAVIGFTTASIIKTFCTYRARPPER